MKALKETAMVIGWFGGIIAFSIMVAVVVNPLLQATA